MIRLRRGRRDSGMASCREVARVMQRYLDREIDEHTAKRVARHLEVCHRCGLESATYQEIKRSLHRRASTIPPAALERLQTFGEQLAASGVPPDQASGAAPGA